MKNLPGRCKSRMMAMKAWGCLPKRKSLLCFFSSFTFLGRLFFLCICLLVFLCCSSCSLAFCSVPLLLRLYVCSFLVIFSSGLSVLPSLPRSSFSRGFLCSSLLYAPPVLFPPLSSSSLPVLPHRKLHGRPAWWEQKLLRPTLLWDSSCGWGYWQRGPWFFFCCVYCWSGLQDEEMMNSVCWKRNRFHPSWLFSI